MRKSEVGGFAFLICRGKLADVIHPRLLSDLASFSRYCGSADNRLRRQTGISAYQDPDYLMILLLAMLCRNLLIAI
jgi:hypothetical protein